MQIFQQSKTNGIGNNRYRVKSPCHTHVAQPTPPPVKMGCGMSTEDKDGKARNDEIENQLKRDKLAQRNEIKMLLLGTSP